MKLYKTHAIININSKHIKAKLKVPYAVVALAITAIPVIILTKYTVQSFEVSTISVPVVHEVEEQANCQPAENCWSEQEKIDRLTRYLKSKNSPLAVCVQQIASHPRAVEAIAIAGIETTFGTRGNAMTDNNPGNIKSGKPDRTWRKYATICDGLEDVAYLIENDRYGKLTIEQMRPIYCGGTAEGCDHWTSTAMRFVNEIRGL